MKLGLVLAGGGGKGAYQIGVWKALRELGIDKHINFISGTSIGAINAILFLQGDLEVAERAWKNISVEKIFPLEKNELLKKGRLLSIGLKKLEFFKRYMPNVFNQGNLSRIGLIDLLDQYVNFEGLKLSSINCYIGCTELPSFKVHYFKLSDYSYENMKLLLLATTAIPSIFEAEEIEGKKYIDGGVVDNIPIQPLYGLNCDIIIVIHLSGLEKVNRNNFPNSKIIEIIPTDIEEDIIEGTLNFESSAIEKRINLGYKDTINLLEPIFRMSKYINENKNKSLIKKIIDKFTNR